MGESSFKPCWEVWAMFLVIYVDTGLILGDGGHGLIGSTSLFSLRIANESINVGGRIENEGVLSTYRNEETCYVTDVVNEIWQRRVQHDSSFHDMGQAWIGCELRPYASVYLGQWDKMKRLQLACVNYFEMILSWILCFVIIVIIFYRIFVPILCFVCLKLMICNIFSSFFRIKIYHDILLVSLYLNWF